MFGIYTAMAAQAAKIIGVEGFEDGGVVGGFSGATAGGDNRIITARNGEMYLNGGEQKSLFDFIKNSGNENNTGDGGELEISLSLKDGLVDFVETEVVRRRAVGISRI